MQKEQGFTILIVPLVLLMVGFIFSATVRTTEAPDFYKEIETTDRMESVQTALASYAHRNFRVPCPADPAAPNASFGDESINDVGGGTPSLIDPCVLDEGILPYKELGLTEFQAKDEWGNFYTYAVSETFSKNPVAKQANGGIYQVAPANGEEILIGYESADAGDPIFNAYAGSEDDALVMSYVHEYCRQGGAWMQESGGAPTYAQTGMNGEALQILDAQMPAYNRNVWKAQFCCSSMTAGVVSNAGTDFNVSFRDLPPVEPDPTCDQANANEEACDRYDEELALWDQAKENKEFINNAHTTQLGINAETGELVAGPSDVTLTVKNRRDNNNFSETIIRMGNQMHKGKYENSGLGFRKCGNQYQRVLDNPGNQSIENDYNNCVNGSYIKLWDRDGIEPNMEIDFAQNDVKSFDFEMAETVEDEIIFYSTELYLADGTPLTEINDFQLIDNNLQAGVDYPSEISLFKVDAQSEDPQQGFGPEINALFGDTFDGEFYETSDGTKFKLEDLRIGKVTIKGGYVDMPWPNDSCSGPGWSDCHHLTYRDDYEAACQASTLNGGCYGSVYAQSFFFGGLQFKSDTLENLVPPTNSDIRIVDSNGIQKLQDRSMTSTIDGRNFYQSANISYAGNLETGFETPVYTLVSHGANGLGAHMAGGGRVGQAGGYAGAGIRELQNINDGNAGDTDTREIVDQRRVLSSDNQHFDDVVMWDSQFTLFNSINNASCETAL